MRIVVDGMGGDNAPKAVVGGVVEAIKEYNVGEISKYAKKMYRLHRYDEVEAEYCAWKKRKD